MSLAPVLIAGEWETARSGPLDSTAATLVPVSPHDRATLGETYPVSGGAEVGRAADAAWAAYLELGRFTPERRAEFLDAYAARLEARAPELVAQAHRETALPVEPRLAKFELPRTINQLRMAATAARERSWALPTIDAANDIRSIHGPIGPVVVFGPNNFPFACNAACGGDFAAAIAAGNPVIAKANPGHLGLTRMLAEEAHAAVLATGLPPATVQLLYHFDTTLGLALMRHPKVGAVAFTGSKTAGLALKAAADEVGKPIYLEMGSVNPTVFLPGALAERWESLVAEFAGSCLMGAGQFCTNPGLVLMLDGPEAKPFVDAVAAAFSKAPAGPLLGPRVLDHLEKSVGELVEAGAQLRAGGRKSDGPGFHFQNTLLATEGAKFLDDPESFQTEAFGNESLVVVAKDLPQLQAIIESLEGNLTGCIYSDTKGGDDALAAAIEPILRRKVGRLLNDKMPTGVTVSPAMNHGGPFPASGHPGFTGIGIPASIRRFSALYCYDAVRQHRLPPELRNANLQPPIWRLVAGSWTKADVG
ncbi:MAG TPA: aldehyde dehydrogenase (NADP(+)) [Planctomycetia bacterium]|nr:aldehyde dehydrogenase (NADP(+)) [Planctomycetia bacterium]